MMMMMMMMMNTIFYTFIFFLCLVSALLLQPCLSTAILVDGVSVWKNPSVHVGDSIIFKHQNHYNLYIFQNKNAFSLCNFTQSTLLTKPNSTSYTWHPSRPGFFYFSFNNGSLNACREGSLKLAIKVITPTPPSKDLPPTTTPAPISGGVISSSPSYPWPFRPRQGTLISPVPAPTENSPVTVPALVPDKGGGGTGGNGGGSTAIPFINSNPAVPLPTGEVDSATIRPLPTSGQPSQVVVGFLAGQTALFSIILLVL